MPHCLCHLLQAFFIQSLSNLLHRAIIIYPVLEHDPVNSLMNFLNNCCPYTSHWNAHICTLVWFRVLSFLWKFNNATLVTVQIIFWHILIVLFNRSLVFTADTVIRSWLQPLSPIIHFSQIYCHVRLVWFILCSLFCSKKILGAILIILLNVVYHFPHFGKNGLEVTRMELRSGNVNELANIIPCFMSSS